MIRKLCVVVALGVMLASTAGWARDDNDEDVPKTGQTTCYGGSPPAQIPCDIPHNSTLYGQDGQLQKGEAWPVPRFIINVNPADDNGAGGAHNGICDGTERCNGTVTDRLTGLVWLRDTRCQSLKHSNPSNWEDALDSAKTLASGQCGLIDGSNPGDWRLPNVNELLSLVDFGFINPALSNTEGTAQWTEGDAFFGLVLFNGEYWTSTTQNPPFQTSVHIVQIGQLGSMYGGTKTDTGRYVWPVRNAKKFAGTHGTANCHGQSVSALAQQYGGLNAAAAALGYPNVQALQKAIMEYCEG
jgi:uncharacterized membrane protein